MYLQVYNSIAVLWTTRDQAYTAVEPLKRSEALYPQIIVARGRSAAAKNSSPADAAGSLGELTLNTDADNEAWWQIPLGITARSVDREHIQTLFLLAQVYGQMQEHEQSASYCAATLQKQLQGAQPDQLQILQYAAAIAAACHGVLHCSRHTHVQCSRRLTFLSAHLLHAACPCSPYAGYVTSAMAGSSCQAVLTAARSNAEEWVRNCIGLAEYYFGSVPEFAVAEYLMRAATQVTGPICLIIISCYACMGGCVCNAM